MLFIFSVYFYTAGKNLNSDGDSIEMITAAYCNGTPHSPGYPLFIRLANLFIKLFGGLDFTVAQRVYLLNNVISIITLALVGLIINNVIRKLNTKYAYQKSIAIILSVLYIAFSRTYWQESITAEVYQIHLFINVIILYMLLVEKPVFTGLNFAVILGIFCGLGLANHISIIFFFPVIFFVLLIKAKWKKIIIFFTIMLITASVFYGDMMTRAKKNPDINLGQPDNFERLCDVVLMKQYGEVMNSGLYTAAKIEFLKKNFFSNEFDLIFFLISIVGFCFFAVWDKKNFYVLTAFSGLYFISVFLFYRQLTYKVVYDTIYVFFLPIYIGISIFFGYGLCVVFILLNKIKIYRVVCVMLIFVVILLISANFVNNFNNNNNRQIKIYEILISDIIDELNFNSPIEKKILLTEVDDLIYLGWYYQVVEKKFNDVLFVHPELLKTEWYRKKNGLNYKNISEFLNDKADNLFFIINDNPEIRKLKTECIGLTFKYSLNKGIVSLQDYRIADNLKEYKKIDRNSIKNILSHYSSAYVCKGIFAAKNKKFKISEDFFIKSLLCDESNIDATSNLLILQQNKK